ncbi:ABC transporter ATP-binding protein [Fodinisporobacter ferrooxydans]|uniref:ABC transporter ATP-binding protein n=1 Tax=Fodinisporobacter ferrooxydans TaxID=2901836 RepID=A0ABY4CL19_9BACL|nr:ABC transporter ATP-binding protein [Alicyclobacillaceae bacterium MYW30-H2]
MLELKQLTVHFQTPHGMVQAVRGVSLQIEEGETLAIVGESGSGKSVAVQSVMRLLPKNSSVSGEILWRGKNLMLLTEKEMQGIRGGEIGMVFQDPMTALNPTMKIGDQIAEALIRHKKFSVNQAKGLAVELLEKVGIPDPRRRADSYPHEYSGGMRQRAVIAIAIACSPRLLIADEPTTALDVTIQAQILELIKELQQQMGMGVLLITHDLAVVHEAADKVAVMYAGRVIEFGNVKDVLQYPAHPYTRGLLNSKPKPGDRSALVPIPGNPPDLLHPPVGCSFASRCPYAMRICAEHNPPVFKTDRQETSCWLLHPQREGRQPWNSYSYGT